jgi:hypothetical protein
VLKLRAGPGLPGSQGLLQRRGCSASRLKNHTWPAYEAPFIRKHEHADVGDEEVPFRELLAGTFGMIPQWGDIKLARNTYNARS